jgi:hypothetical protein
MTNDQTPIRNPQSAIRNRPLIRNRRRGSALVEGAIVLPVFLLMLLCMLDLGLAVLRSNMLSDAARRLAREATVRGEMAPPRRSAWGPHDFTGTAGDGSPAALAVEPFLVAVRPNEVHITIVWPDGGNADNQRVEVVVSYDHHPVLPWLYGATGPLHLRAESTMRIEH